FQSDFGDTAALMLTVASPKDSEVELALRARQIAAAISRVRESAPADLRANRVALVTQFPEAIGASNVARVRDALIPYLRDSGYARDLRPFDGSGFVGFDAVPATSRDLRQVVQDFVTEHVGASVFPAIHPDAWPPVLIRDPSEAEAALSASAGDKYTYHQLERYTDLMQRVLETLPNVEKVARSGILPEWVQLAYSQRRLASYGETPTRISAILSERNIIRPGGTINADGTDVPVHPGGEFSSVREIGDVMVATSQTGSPLYLREVADVL